MKVELESTECPLCGSRDADDAETIRWRDGDLIYAVCHVCGLKHMRQRPTREWCARYYAEEFWEDSHRHPDVDRTTDLVEWPAASFEDLASARARPRKRLVWRAERIWGITERHVSLSTHSTVIEIGAGWGELLRLVKDKTGARVVAVEPSSMTREHMAREGIEIGPRVLEELDDSPELQGSADLVVCSHVLENTTDPVVNLGRLGSLLKDGGSLYLETPNVYYNNSINPYHPVIFSPETVRSLMGRAGFRIIRTHGEMNPMHLRRVRSAANARYYSAVAVRGERREEFFAPQHPLKEIQRAGHRLLDRRAAIVRWRQRIETVLPFIRAPRD